MRDEGPIRKDLSGDTEAAAPYIGAARTLLGQVKNQMKLGGLDQLARSTVLPDGTTIRAESRFGQSTVRIVSPSGEVTPLSIPEIETPEFPIETPELPTIEPPELPGTKYLLAIFNNNEVAAIPMVALTAPKWPVVYHKVLEQGSLDGTSPVAQYRFNMRGADSEFLAPFSLSGKDIVLASDQQFWLNVIKTSNVDDPNVVSSIRVDEWANGFGFNWMPHLNASGSMVYTSSGGYSYTGGELTRAYANSGAPFAPANFVYPDGRVRYNNGITDNTSAVYVNTVIDYYQNLLGNGLPPLFDQMQKRILQGYTLDFPFTIAMCSGWGELQNGQVGRIETKGVPINIGIFIFPIPEPTVFPGRLGPNQSQQGDFLYDTEDLSLDFVVPQLAQDGRFDRLIEKTVTGQGSYTYHEPWLLRFDTGVCQRGCGLSFYQAQGARFGYTTFWREQQDTLNNGPQIFTRTGLGPVTYKTFPPAPPSGADFVYAFHQDPNSSVGGSSSLADVKTPYFSTAVDLAFSAGALQGWLHLSNGRHYLQGYWIGDQQSLYLDGADVSGKLAEALRTNINNVQAILIDIPLPVIKRLK
jgi:hypothetical protein